MPPTKLTGAGMKHSKFYSSQYSILEIIVRAEKEKES